MVECNNGRLFCAHCCYLFSVGMAGLAVTYGLNLNARLSRWILSFCKLENKIISIERIYQYSQIPREAPTIIEDSRPPSSWPENGTIEIIDLKVPSSASHLFFFVFFSSSQIFIVYFLMKSMMSPGVQYLILGVSLLTLDIFIMIFVLKLALSHHE